MTSLDVLAKTDHSQKARAGLPREAYISSEIYHKELQRILPNQWFIVGHESAVQRIGEYFEKEIGPESLIVCRDDQNTIRAFFNNCRHRGYRLLDENATGRGRTLVCPYHKWTYNLDGGLRGVPGATDGEFFNFSDCGLRRVKCETWNGWIWVHLGENAPDLKVLLDSAGDAVAMNTACASGMKLAHRKKYRAKANWKSVLENETECYHCAHGHPMLAKVNNFRSLFADEWDGEFFSLNDGMQTFSTTGELVSTRLSDELPDGFNTGVFTGPMFCGLVVFADHAVSLIATPISVGETQMICEWYVRADAVEGVDYRTEELIEIFDQTNREDVAFSERNYIGVQSIGHVPGPVHPTREAITRKALDDYLELMQD